jgi:hypothetical protein
MNVKTACVFCMLSWADDDCSSRTVIVLPVVISVGVS